MVGVGVLAIVLAACAVLLLLGAEWPRISRRFGLEARSERRRARRKRRLTVVQPEDSDDFAESVERDLANLPVFGDPDERSRR
jgi:hypothetical protein